MAELLPAWSRMAKLEHHAALPWREEPAFLAELREQEGVAVMALEFAILCASRTASALSAAGASSTSATGSGPCRPGA